MMRTNGWMRTVAQMDAATFAAVLDHVDATTARTWCIAHPDEVLPTGLMQRLIDHGDAYLTAQLARRPMPDEQVEELLKDRRVAVAEALLDRDELTAAQLRRLLERDSTTVSAKVWEHPACTDELRRLILSGTTMNPRARDKDRTISTPDLDLDDIPERLQPALAETASPSLYHLHLRAVERELSDPSRLHLELERAFRLAVRANGRRRGAWSPWVAAQPLERLTGHAARGDDPELGDLAQQLKMLTRSPGSDALERGLAAHAAWTERSAAGTDVAAALRRGDARAADLESLTRDDVAALTGTALPGRSVRMLLQRRPDLAPDAWWDAAREELDAVAAPVAVLDRWVRDGRTIVAERASRGFRTSGQRLLAGGTAAHVAALVAPAEAAPLFASDPAALAAWLAGRLGTDETSWATFAELLDGFDGTLAQLAETVVALRPAA